MSTLLADNKYCSIKSFMYYTFNIENHYFALLTIEIKRNKGNRGCALGKDFVYGVLMTLGKAVQIDTC